MGLSVFVEQSSGEYVATLVGSPAVRAVRPTREAALAALQSVLAKHISTGHLVTLDVPKTGVTALFGKYADDPTLEDICKEAYRERDAEPKE